MIEQEVIEILNKINSDLAKCYANTISQRSALSMAITTLEKQIPKKPEKIDYESYINIVENAKFLRDAYWCPNCKTVIKSGSYCDYCGQAIDWAE